MIILLIKYVLRHCLYD